MSKLTFCYNPLGLDLREPKWKNLMQKLDMAYYHCSMPVLENVHVTLLEILEVRGSSLTEAELWSVLHQTVVAIQDLFLKGCAHKDGIPQQLVTLNSLQCTAMGRVLLSSCNLTSVEGTPYWCNDMQNAASTTVDLDIEMMYVYTLGQTLHLASIYGQSDSQSSCHLKISTVLRSTIQAMKHSNIKSRMKLSDLMKICYVHGINIIEENSFSNYIVHLHREVLGSIPEHDILNQVEKDVSMENELMLHNSSPEDDYIPESRRPSIEYIDKSVIYGHRLRYNPFTSSLSSTICSSEEKVNPKERWKRAVTKIISKKKCKKLLTDINSIPSEWKEHKAKDSILRVYEELTERRKMLELLRMSINIGNSFSLPVNQDTALMKGLKPKTLAELVMLLQCPNKQSSLQRSSIRNSKMNTISTNNSNIGLRNDVILGTVSEEEINTRKENKSENIIKTPFYSLNEIASQKNEFYKNNSIQKKIQGPEFVVMSVKPAVSLSLNTRIRKSVIHKNRIFLCQITVVLLNGIHLHISCDTSVLVKDIFNIALTHLSLPDNSIFGLAFKHDGDLFFLESHEKLFKQILKCWLSDLYCTKRTDDKSSLTLYWRIKFYVKDINLIRHPGIRHQYYLQFRRDILEERIYCDDNEAKNLAGYALQAEFGDFKRNVHKNYFLLEHYLPQNIIDEADRSIAKEELMKLHESHYGLSVEISELEFMQGVQKLSEYGYHFYKVMQDKRHLASYVWIGIFEEGIDVFEEKGNKRNKIQEYPWKEIYRISYTNHYFALCPRIESITGWHIHFKFYVTHSVKSKCLFSLTMSHHQFYVKLKSRVKASEIFCEDFETDSTTNELNEITEMEVPLEIGQDFQQISQQQQALPWQQFTKGARYLGSLVNLRGTPRRSTNKKKGKRPITIKPLVLTKYQKEVISKIIDPTKPIIKSASAPENVLNENIEEKSVDLFKYEFEAKNSGCCADKETRTINITKDEKVGLGITITCGNTFDSILCGAIVESIKPDGPAYKEGLLKIGDHIITVNGEFLENAHYLDVVDMIQDSPPAVELTVRAHYDDILLSENKQISNESDHNNFPNIKQQINLKESAWNSFPNLLNKTSFPVYCNGKSSNKQPPVPKPRKKWSEKSQIFKSNCTDQKLISKEDNNISDSTNKNRKVTKNELNNEILEHCFKDLTVELHDNEGNRIFDTDFQNNQVIDTKEMENNTKDLKKTEIMQCDNVTLDDSNEIQKNIDLNMKPKDMLVPRLISVCSYIPSGSTETDKKIYPDDDLLEANDVYLHKVTCYEADNVLSDSSKGSVILKRRKTLEKQHENSESSEIYINDISDEIFHNIEDYNMKKWQVVRTSKDNLPKPNSYKTSTSLSDLCSTKEASQEKTFCHSNQVINSQVHNHTTLMPPLNCDKVCIEDDQISCETSSGISTGSSSLLPCVQEEKNNPNNSCCNYKGNFESQNFPIIINKDETSDLGKKVQCHNNENLLNTVTSSFSLTENNQNISKKLMQNFEYTPKNFTDLDLTVVPKIPQRRFRQLKKVEDIYKFITNENTFDIHIRKSSRGLGLSICGGYDMGSKGCINQLIRIRKLYPLQPAMVCGKLQVGDVIIEVNGKSTLKLTHTEALDALRAAPTNVMLKIHRPDPTVIPSLPLNMRDDSCPSFSLESPPSSVNSTLSRTSSINNNSSKEFEIVIEKQDGSLGFTIVKKEECDDTFPGLFIKDLIREPAISDGRIHPGDKILQVNDTDMSNFSHTEAINFLRSASKKVKLKLYRDIHPPLSPLSGDDEPSFAKPLRREAVELLSDWAKQKENDSPGRKRERRRVRAKINDSSSSSGSRSNSSSMSQDNTFLISDSDNNILSEDELSNSSPGLKRSLRPKSLDILSSFTRKQRLANFSTTEDEINAIHRQTSVKLTNSDIQSSVFIPTEEKGNAKKNLLKWRGTTLPENDSESENETNLEILNKNYINNSLRENIIQNISESKIQLLEVQLDRGWHGRLGFSIYDPLNTTENSLPNGPEVKIVHEGSLAAQDGRIKAGDRLVKVNGESVDERPAAEVIDILRKTTGLVTMIFARLKK